MPRTGEPPWFPEEPIPPGVRDAARELEAAMDVAGETGSAPAFVSAAGALAQYRMALGDAEAALGDASPALAWIREKGLWVWGGEAVSAAIEALLVLGRTAEACGLLDELRGALVGRDAPAARASLLISEGMVAQTGGQVSLAAARFEAAQRAWEGLRRPYHAALAKERLGRVLMEADPASGAMLLRAAAGELRVLCSASRVAEVRDLLGRRELIGAVDRRRPAKGRRHEGLTAREEQVVQLASQGKTNREIATLLFLSERTVESHIRGALKKQSTTKRLRRGRAPRVYL